MKRLFFLKITIVCVFLACNKNTKSKVNITSSLTEKNLYRNIEFLSQGALLRGRLYVPKNSLKKKPVVVMAHGFTTTINGMTADKYAEEFYKAGYAVLLYDHRNFGISDGEPRQEINFWIQARGYIDAIDFVSTQPEINKDKIAIWGASLSAREAFLVGSVDERVKVIINQIPAYGDDFPTEDKNNQLYKFSRKTVLAEKIKDLPHTVTKSMPVVSSDQLGTPSALQELTAYRWFIEYGGRYGTNWKNRVSFSVTEAPKQFHIGQCAQHLKAPIIIVAAIEDEMKGASSKVTREVFKMITQKKELIEVEGGHFGLLHYPSSLFDKSSKAQINFLNTYLK